MSLRGATFRLKGSSEDCFHLWIIVGKEMYGRVLAINITDERWSPDSPCKINIEDHSEITKPSVVFYKKAREFSAKLVAEQLDSQIAVTRFEDASEELLKRIEENASKSDDFTSRLLSYF